MPDAQKAGLVLSGGGVRGAYEVGVLLGISEVLGLRPSDPAPFDIFAGTSIGAVNVTFLAASSHLGDMGIGELARVWCSLRLRRHLRVTPTGFLPAFMRRRRQTRRGHLGRSLLDPYPLERLIDAAIPWESLHRNVDAGRVAALFIAALDAASGRTTVFAEVNHEEHYAPSRDPRRHSQVGPISIEHVMASAAIPGLFPARRIGNGFFFDGGLRFNTPVAPAIRAGADRLLVISVQSGMDSAPPVLTGSQEPSLTFLFGKLLNALLLDPVAYDLQVLSRLNAVMDVLQRAVDSSTLAEIQRLLVETRGAPYRHIRTLVFSPSQDVGHLAGAYLREHIDTWDLDLLPQYLLRRAARAQHTWEADWASYLLFDGKFAQRLITLGRKDAQGRAAEIRAFF